MAERRMFAKSIIDSDAFLDMPLSTQALYFHLSMRADDDGFINNPKRVQRVVGGSDDDIKLLVAKRFIIPFDSGVVVIKHWKIHNYIQKDRYKPTTYIEEKSTLSVKQNGSYTECVQDGYNLDTQVSIGEVNEVNKDNNAPQKRFTKPTIEEVKKYCMERNNGVDAQRWFDYYSSNGWKVGKNPMKDWKAAVRTWERSNDNGKCKNNNRYAQYTDEC